MNIVDLVFATLGLPVSLAQAAGSEGRYLRTKWRYRGVKFGRGSNADTACSFEDGVIVRENTVLSCARICAYSYVGGNSTLCNCEIGRFCSIGPEVRIGLGIHPTRGVISTYPGFYSCHKSVPITFRRDASIVEYRSVNVGNDVWIGARAIVLDGVRIGDGAVVGAGSIVTRDVPAYCVVAGNPARVVRERFSREQANRLVRFAWWERGVEFCSRHAAIFSTPDQFFTLINSEDAADAPDGAALGAH
jgi:acetyltransferase-like isoleucine patch superfamily enzyme